MARVVPADAAGGFAIALRVGVLMLLAVAAVSLLALSGEYPGQTAAGVRVAVRTLLPLALVAWLDLAALHDRRLLPAAVLADAALFAWTLPYARPGAPPVSVALPVVAAFMTVGAAGLAWTGRRAVRSSRVESTG